MDSRIYFLIHVFSVIMLSGSILYIAANPQKHRKKLMMTVTGILGLLAFVGGFGLMERMGHSYSSGWFIVKLVLWLFLMALAGMAYRKSKSFVLSALTLCVAVSVYMVYFKPF